MVMYVINDLQQIIENGCNYEFRKESELREKVVTELLKSLGWDSFTEVEHEVPVRVGTERLEMDYLVGTKESKFVIEAKKSTLNIINNNNAYGQLISYMKLTKEPVDYGFIYNGKNFLIFRKNDEKPFLEWACGDPISVIEAFSKKNFPGKLEEMIEDQTNREIVSEFISEEKDSLKRTIISEIEKKTNTPRDFLEKNLEVTLELISDINDPMITANGVSGGNNARVRNRKRSFHVSRFIIGGELHKIKHSNEILIDTAEWLIKRGKLTISNCKITSGSKRYITNDAPYHQNGGKFVQPHQLSNGVFIELHNSGARSEALAKLLLDRFGYPEDTIQVEWGGN